MKTNLESSSIFNNFYYFLLLIILVLIIVITMFILFPPLRIAFSALAVIIAALLAAGLTLQKYFVEVRTSRLQKIYFEDTLLGQAKAIEKMMSQTTQNMLLVENISNLALNILRRNNVDIISVKSDLENIFTAGLIKIDIDVGMTYFKLETISKLLSDANIKSPLAGWINQFQSDAYRFSHFLKSQFILLKPFLGKLSSTNQKDLEKYIHEILGTYVAENYILIKRHFILFSLFSEFVLEFSHESYANIEDIFFAFKKEKIKKILKLIDERYTDLVAKVNGIEIANITREQSNSLKQEIECAKKIIAESLTEH